MVITKRLYYTDPYATSFTAQVLERTLFDGHPAVTLDQTYFYPTSGGQPHDTGTLNAVAVINVLVREADGAVLHVLDRDLPGDTVTGAVDWARRFDHMQHHTGQHILSQAFIQTANAETIGFHLSADSVTIDLDTPDISPALIEQAEALANHIIMSNRPVRAWFPGDAELATLDLRKVPDVDGKFRVVMVEDFDVNACGGTHVAHSGEIGLVKVLRAEKRGDATRIEFQCGQRALRDYHDKHTILSQLAAELTTSYADVPASLDKMRAENKALRREIRALRAVVVEHEAESLWQSAERLDHGVLAICALEDRDPGTARQLVQHLISHPATIALCGIAGDKAQLIMARSDDLDTDMVPVLMRGLAVWGVEHGGGRPSFAQGGGPPANLSDVQNALDAAAAWVRANNHKD